MVMFCGKCGKEIEAGAMFCSGCGVQVNITPVNKIPIASQKIVHEIIIKEGLCNRVKSPLFVQNGHGMLTNKRFIYSKHSLASIATMGVLVNLTSGTYDFEISLPDIANMREGRQGISKTIILTKKTGEEYNFYFSNRETWENEFKKLIESEGKGNE